MNKSKSPLIKLLPRNSHDVDSVSHLLSLGYPAIEPVLPHLFQWLETNGSDVELSLRPFFAQLGAPLRELASEALRSRTKPAVKYSLLRYIIPHWPREVVVTLPLEGFLYDVDAYALDIWALKIMVDMRIPTHDGLKGLNQCREWKITNLKERLQLLEDMPKVT